MLHIIRFTSLVIGLFFVMHALESCSVHAHQDGEAAGERHVAGEETVNQQEFLDGFGGRKMGGHGVAVRKEMLEVGASKNSGENNDAEFMSIGKFQDQANNQVSGFNKLEPKTSNFAGLGIPTKDQPFHHPSSVEESKTVPPKASLALESHPYRSDKPVTQDPRVVIGDRVESKRLLEAAKEIVNLMQKDYKGSDRPRRKPPINNHVPRH